MAKKHSAHYQTYKDRYARKGCTKEQIHRLVEIGRLYDWEYKEITGEPYA